MCGIVGLLGREDRPLVSRMAHRMAHRGPDGEGLYTDGAAVTLGHRRLAILDVEHGQQPMQSQDGRHCIVYNGETYNHEALRADLEAQGVAFRTRTDTETVLEAYRAWGPAMLHRMEGMYALAVWDSQERTLFVARDPFGTKPFFHAFSGDGDWVFASEQKALFAHPGVRCQVHEDHVKERAVLEFLTGQGTLFHGVRQLPPGTWALLHPGDRRVAWRPWYTVAEEGFPDVQEAARQVGVRFEASVREQLMSDVPLGTVLSGGLDSAAVAAVHQRLAGDAPVHTFTVADSEDVEDFRQARRVAEHLGTEHHEALFGLEDMQAGLPAFTWHNESINYTEFFFQPLFALARRHVKVALCGQGSDELWGGYARYRDPLHLAKERVSRIREAAPAHQEELCTLVAQTHTSASALSEWDQQGQLQNFQLRLVDRNSMAHGLEVRVPFLSRPLHAASRAVPWGWKMHRGSSGARATVPASEGKPHRRTSASETSGAASPQGERTRGMPEALPRGQDGSSGARATVPASEGKPHRRTSASGPPSSPPVEKWVLRKALEGVGLPREMVWRPKVPAGRATSPGTVERFEAYAARLVPRSSLERHPLAGTFRAPAERLLYDLFVEVFVERDGRIGGLTLEDLA